MRLLRAGFGLLVLLIGLIARIPLLAADGPVKLTIDWNKVEAVSKTITTLQVVVNPPLRRGSAIHDRAFQALHDLQGDYVRYVPWLPYPKLAVAELEPPTADKTFWDFSLIDPMTLDFLQATAGHPVVLNFSTIPQWMFRTDAPVSYPNDPNEVNWSYEQGTELRDPSMKEVGDYYASLVSWYTQGGFTDELGQRHESGYHYKIDYWEVLNEPEYEHAIGPQAYTKIYDAAVTAIRRVAPQMKFVGMSLATPSRSPESFEYFLDPKNHQPGIPLDAISYHFYAVPTADQSPEVQSYTFFEQADHFLDTVRYIESIRRRLSPQTRSMINEVGSITADDLSQAEAGHVVKPIPNSYWNLSAALYAYLYAELARLGVDVVGESQLVGYPTQFPSVSLVDWNTGQPNARYWVLKLLRENFGPGDKLVETSVATPSVYARAFVTSGGKRKILLVNKRDRAATLSLPAAGAHIQVLDQSTGFQAPGVSIIPASEWTLPGLSVAVVTLDD